MIADEGPRRKIHPQDGGGGCRSSHAAEPRGGCPGGRYWNSTLLRWQKEPEFQAAYRQARREAFGQATARLQQASGAAVSTLLKVMVDQNTPASTKVRAADCVLDRAGKAIELEDIEARLSELERAAEASKPGHNRRSR